MHHQNIPTDQNLRDVQFTDSLNGWIVGDEGMILKTSDGGLTWQQQVSNTLAQLNSVSFVDSLHGWAAGMSTVTYTGIIVKTSDGGITWEGQGPVSEGINCIHFLDTLTGWVTGWDNMLLKTEDGGDSWSPVSAPYMDIINRVQFVNDQVGFIGGIFHDGNNFHLAINKTIDGGETWQQTTDWVDHYFTDFHFLDELHGWFTGGYEVYGIGGNTYTGKIICLTSNGSGNWSKVYDDEDVGPLYVFFTDADHGWVCGNSGLMMVSQDGGINWNVDFLEPGEDLHAITFIDAERGWAVGSNGVVFFIENAGSVGIADHQQENGLAWIKVFPNPATQCLTAQFIAKDFELYELSIYNLSGENCRSLYRGFPGAGLFELKINIDNLQQGIYFIRLSSSGFSTVKKLIVK